MKNKLVKSLLLISIFSLVGCKGDPSYIDENFVDITFNAGEGRFKETGLQTRLLRIRKGLKWKDVSILSPTKSDISNPGKSLSYWKNGDHQIQENESFQKNTQLDAVYINVTTIKVTFQCGDDTYYGTEENPVKVKTLTMDVNTTYKEIKSEVIPNVTTTAKAANKIFHYFDDTDSTHIFDDYAFIKDQTVTAICKEAEKPSSFTSDPWSLFGYLVSEKGLAYIKTNTHDNYGYKEDLINGSFVGLERDLTIGGKTHKVRVIGEGVDSIKEDGSEKAALTFEFVDVIEDSVSFDIEEKTTTSWFSSSIRTYFDSLYERDVDSSIKGYLKNVYKACAFNNGKDVETTYVSDNFFALSNTEYGIVKGSEEGQREDINVEGLKTDTGWDGAYPFYVNNPDKREKIFTGKTTYNCSYYTRSVDTESSSGYAWNMDSSGNLSKNSTSVYIGHGISPAFCIGGKL